MRKRYSRSYTVLSFLTMFSYREQPSRSFLFVCGFSKAPMGWLLPPQGLAPNKRMRNALPPSTPCLPCVRGGAERMRSGGVVGLVQEKVACNRLPAPIRRPQPLSQGLRPCQLPLHRGAKPCGGRGLVCSRNYPMSKRYEPPLTPSPTGGRPAGAAAPGPSGNNTRRRAGW